MNSTTSLPLTSLSIHCSMLIFVPFAAHALAAAIHGRCPSAIYVAQVRRAPQGFNLLLGGSVKGPLDLEYVVLIEAIDLHDGARRVWPLPPQLLLHLVHQRAEAEHVGHIDHDPHRVGEPGALRF